MEATTTTKIKKTTDIFEEHSNRISTPIRFHINTKSIVDKVGDILDFLQNPRHNARISNKKSIFESPSTALPPTIPARLYTLPDKPNP